VCVETEPADMAFSAGSLPPSSRRDRTSEFHAIADRLRKSTQSSSSSSANGSTVNGSSSATTSNGHHHHHEQPSRVHGPESVGSTQSEFNRRASRIGLSIHQTSQKLSKLTKCKVTAEEETLD
jgi:syntaxin 5